MKKNLFLAFDIFGLSFMIVFALIICWAIIASAFHGWQPFYLDFNVVGEGNYEVVIFPLATIIGTWTVLRYFLNVSRKQ